MDKKVLKFKSVEAAIDGRNRMKGSTPSFFCPLMRSKCNKLCVCIMEPGSVKGADKENPYEAHGWGCKNAMFFTPSSDKEVKSG